MNFDQMRVRLRALGDLMMDIKAVPVPHLGSWRS